jgi:hypothetical protein
LSSSIFSLPLERVLCLLLRNITSSNRLKVLLPSETQTPRSARPPLSKPTAFTPIVPENNLEGSETEMDSWKLQAHQEKSQTPPAADGLVLQCLFSLHMGKG